MASALGTGIGAAGGWVWGFDEPSIKPSESDVRMVSGSASDSATGWRSAGDYRSANAGFRWTHRTEHAGDSRVDRSGI